MQTLATTNVREVPVNGAASAVSCSTQSDHAFARKARGTTQRGTAAFTKTAFTK